MFRQMMICSLVVVVGGSALANDKANDRSSAKNVGFEKLKSLAGTWVAADADGKPTDQVVSVIKVTAGGTAIHETLFPGQDHEMVSIYTPDGSGVLMTHYCVLGNQPRMKATPKEGDKQLKFEFVGGDNLDPKKDKHMHCGTLTIVDADHIELEGCGWENGGPSKEMCHGMKLVRKK